MASNKRRIKEPDLQQLAQKELLRAIRLARKIMEENPERKTVLQKLLDAGYNAVVVKEIYKRARREFKEKKSKKS